MEQDTELAQLQTWFKTRIARFKHLIKLVQLGKKPVIHDFYTDELFTVEHGKVCLTWNAQDFHALKINQKVGDVTDRKQIIVRLEPNVRSFTLTAYGGFSKTIKTIHIEPVSFRDEKMPMANIHEPYMQIKLPKLRESHSEKKGKDGRLQQTNERGIPELYVNLPNKPKAVELQKLRSELKEAFQVKEVAVLEAQLAKLKQTDLLEKLTAIDYSDTSKLRESNPN